MRSTRAARIDGPGTTNEAPGEARLVLACAPNFGDMEVEGAGPSVLQEDLLRNEAMAGDLS